MKTRIESGEAGTTTPMSPLQRPTHAMPDDVARSLADGGLTDAYEARPPYQRNDYLGWIARAKRPETRERRLRQMLDELAAGDVYMNMEWRSGRTDDDHKNAGTPS